MIDLTELEDAPHSEPIHTMMDQRRESQKAVGSRLRKGGCAKNPWSRKQALTAAAYHTKQTGKPIRTYKCPECGFFHLTSKKPWDQSASRRKSV